MVTWILCSLHLTLASVVVYQPDDLWREMNLKYDDGHIPASLATFGDPPYGRTISGKVYVPKLGQEKACSWLDHIDFKDERQDSPILLIERGQCSFVVKVRNAQNIGAAAVIF